MADVTSRFQQLRDRHGWLDHLVRAGARYTERHGNDYGAAVTYFSVLSLVPVTMVAFAAAGFALGAQPAVVERLKNEITAAWPGALGDMLNSVINQAISSAATVGFVGLLVALYSGIGWMTNLRDAVSEQWGHLPTRPPFVKRVLFDLLALLGLGLALTVTFAVTGLLSGFAGTVLAFLGLAQRPWAEALLTLLGVLIGLAANWLIFVWVIARLPRERRGPAQRGQGGRAGCGGVRGAQAGHGHLSADDHQDAQRGGVRIDPRPARVHLLRVAVRAVRDGVGGDVAGGPDPGTGRGARACGDPFGGGGHAPAERRHNGRATRSRGTGGPCRRPPDPPSL